MTRLATAFVVASVLAAGSIAGTAAPAPTGDLWIGVLQHSVLVPAAALVSGRWWQFINDGADANRLSERVGTMPARWLPPGRLPTSWRAFPFKGRTTWLRTVGPLFKRDSAGDEFGVHTDLPLPGPSPSDWEEEATGIAIVGAASVRLFKPVAGLHPELWTFAATAIVAAQRTSIKAHLQTLQGTNHQDLLPGPADPISGTKPLDDAHVLSSKLGDGAEVYVLDGINYIREKATKEQTCFLRINAAVRRDPSGALSMVGASAEPWCDELEISYTPLMILERGGQSCWLMQLLFEDGIEYRLTRPAHAVFEANASECTLR